MKRDWRAARAKVDTEGSCRACGTGPPLESAHIVPRSRLRADEGAEDPLNVIPLCPQHHLLHHAGHLELLPLLTLPEQGYVAGLVGIEEARRRTTRDAA